MSLTLASGYNISAAVTVRKKQPRVLGAEYVKSAKELYMNRIKIFGLIAAIICASVVLIRVGYAQTIDEAKTLFDAKQYSQAESILLEILKKNGNDPQANLYIGKLYHIQKKYDLAETHLKKAVSKDKMLADGYYELGQLSLNKTRGFLGSRQKEAENYFKKALGVNPNHGDAKFGLYQVYFDEDEPKKAFDLLSEYVKENPNSTKGLMELARLWKYYEFNMLRRLAIVHDLYLAALGTNPESIDDLFEIGWGLFLCDDLLNARLVHSRAVYVAKELSPEQYLDMMVVAYENLDYGTAREYLTKAFEKMSDPATAGRPEYSGLTDPKRIPDFVLDELYDTYNVEPQQFLDPQFVPTDQTLYIKQIYHFSVLWTVNRSGIERFKPLNYTGNHQFDTPYLLFGGLHNYLDYAFYYSLDGQEAKRFLSIPNQYERAEWRRRWFREHDTTPTNNVNELEEEFINRVNYVHEEFKIMPNKFNRSWHANEQIGFDDRGKVWLKYGKPYTRYLDFGGDVNKETMDNPYKTIEKYTLSSPFLQTVVKQNQSWIYSHLDDHLSFDFVEINSGYFTYVESLEDAVVGGGQNTLRLYLNPNRANIGGPYVIMYSLYSELLRKIDTRNESLLWLDETEQQKLKERGLGDQLKQYEFIQSDFLFNLLVPEVIKRNKVMEEYPTNLVDLGKPKNRLPMYLDMATFKGDSGSTKVELYTAVDYRNLGYAKESDNKRLAYLEYSIVVKDKDIITVTKDTSFNQIVADPNDITKDNSWMNWFTFNLNPDVYWIYVNSKNYQGNKESVLKLPANLQNYYVDSLVISDIQLSLDIQPASERKTFVKNGLSVIPYPYRIIKRDKPISFYYEIYNLSQYVDGSTSYDVNIAITVYEPNVSLRNALKNLMPGRTEKVEVSFKNSRSGKTRDAVEFISLDVSSVMPGSAQIKIEVIDNISKKKTYKTLDVLFY